MSRLIESMLKDGTKIRTENGMRTFSTSLDACLDLFFLGGAIRKRTDNEVITLFAKALHENTTLAIRILGYIRDCRGGMGERKVFRLMLKYALDAGVGIHASQIPVLGRWDDIFTCFGTRAEKDALNEIIKALGNKDGLCAKWMPRKGKIARKIYNELHISPKQYRQLIVGLSKTVETQMCNNEWKGIKYTAVPSVANIKYNKAFLRHDDERRREFLSAAKRGEVKINSSVNFPHDIVKMVLQEAGSAMIKEGETFAKVIKRNDDGAVALWNALPNYLKDNKDIRLLPIADTSGSMAGLPILISISLALYLSERNEGIFKDAFITFSQNPTLQYVKGDLIDRISQIRAYHPRNTDLGKSFELILQTAVKNNIKHNEMPTHLVIISDMEFDQATNPNQNALKMIKLMYKEYGYEMPNIIFWNVNSKQDNVPVRMNKDGVGLVSGASPAVIKAVLSGEVTPMKILERAVNQDKYYKLLNG